MSDAISQVNVRLSDEVIKRAKIDSIKLNIPLQQYFTEAVDAFSKKNLNAKRILFERAKRKTVGRKITVESQKNFPQANGVKPSKQENG